MGKIQQIEASRKKHQEKKHDSKKSLKCYENLLQLANNRIKELEEASGRSPTPRRVMATHNAGSVNVLREPKEEMDSHGYYLLLKKVWEATCSIEDDLSQQMTRQKELYVEKDANSKKIIRYLNERLKMQKEASMNIMKSSEDKEKRNGVLDSEL